MAIDVRISDRSFVPPLSTEQLVAAFDRAAGLRIGVIGDFFLDRYLLIDPSLDEPSRETGRIAQQVVGIRHSAGAAGTVTNNLRALGVGHVYAIGAIGDDGHGLELDRVLIQTGVDGSALVRDRSLWTPTYTKPMRLSRDGEEEGERIDFINRKNLPAAIEAAIMENINKLVPALDVLMVTDQVIADGHGIMTKQVRNHVSEVAKRNRHLVTIADSRARILEFPGFLIKPNIQEARMALAISGDIDDEELARRLTRHVDASVILTCGANGMIVADQNAVQRISSIDVPPPVDIVGAGDSAACGFAIGIAAGLSIPAAAWIGTLVASLTVQCIGTTGTASAKQVIDRHHACVS